MLANCRSKFLLDRLGRCLKMFVSTESISCHEFGLAIFIREKHLKLSWIPHHICLFEWSTERPFIASRIGEKGPLTSSWLDAHQPIEQRQPGRRRRWVCVHACLRDVFAIYNNIIWPRLIMIIIKNIILYFIQIRHTDDSPQRVLG